MEIPQNYLLNQCSEVAAAAAVAQTTPSQEENALEQKLDMIQQHSREA